MRWAWRDPVPSFPECTFVRRYTAKSARESFRFLRDVQCWPSALPVMIPRSRSSTMLPEVTRPLQLALQDAVLRSSRAAWQRQRACDVLVPTVPRCAWKPLVPQQTVPAIIRFLAAHERYAISPQPSFAF